MIAISANRVPRHEAWVPHRRYGAGGGQTIVGRSANRRNPPITHRAVASEVRAPTGPSAWNSAPCRRGSKSGRRPQSLEDSGMTTTCDSSSATRWHFFRRAGSARLSSSATQWHRKNMKSTKRPHFPPPPQFLKCPHAEPALTPPRTAFCCRRIAPVFGRFTRSGKPRRGAPSSLLRGWGTDRQGRAVEPADHASAEQTEETTRLGQGTD